MLFRTIKFDDKQLIDGVLAETTYNGSEYSMLYLFGWSFFNLKTMQIAEEEGVVYLRFIPKTNAYDEAEGADFHVYLPPLTTLDKIATAYARIEAQCVEDATPFRVIATPQEYVDALGERYALAFDDNSSEYLYSPLDLIELRGKKYHAKRNQVSKFVGRYSSPQGGYIFRAVEEKDFDCVMRLCNDWDARNTFSQDEYAGEEREEMAAIRNDLAFLSKSDDYFADVIEYEGKCVGFSLGEITASGVGIVHIEKGDVTFDGIYQALNQMFAKKHFSDVRIINRQEDMGLEGLRKSKSSYHPTSFCRKYVVTLKP